jgi:hypothetical protein
VIVKEWRVHLLMAAIWLSGAVVGAAIAVSFVK